MGEKTFTVEFTQTVSVEAKDEEEALALAKDSICEDGSDLVSVSDFYVYINGECVN